MKYVIRIDDDDIDDDDVISGLRFLEHHKYDDPDQIGDPEAIIISVHSGGEWGGSMEKSTSCKLVEMMKKMDEP